jgi:hypothetical protein
MKREHELKHMENGPEPGESPNPAEGLGLVRFDVHCEGNSEAVLPKAREVLRAVVSQSPVGWPSFEQWQAILPAWFVSECADEITQEEADRWLRKWQEQPIEERLNSEEDAAWSLSEWLYWFEPKRRYWYWWDARVESPDLIRLAVEVRDWPFPWDALKWLFRVSGASSVTAEE